MNAALILTAMAALQASQPAREPAIDTAPASYIRAEDHEIAATGYRLVSAGARFCSEPAPLHGLTLHQLAEYAPRDRPLAAAQFGIDQAPGILNVVEDSPAARAGLKAGDLLLSVNDRRFVSPVIVAQRHDEEGGRDGLNAADSLLESELSSGSATLEIMRKGEKFTAQLIPVTGCPSRFRLARSSQPNAFADGNYAIVTTKLHSFLRNEDELAIVLAHEIAHNILGHAARLREQKVPRGILRSFGKNAGRVWATEEEADRLMVKLLWAAGYDLNAVVPFWERFYGKREPLPLQIFRTHPSLGARKKIFAEAVNELRTEPLGTVR